MKLGLDFKSSCGMELSASCDSTSNISVADHPWDCCMAYFFVMGSVSLVGIPLPTLTMDDPGPSCVDLLSTVDLPTLAVSPNTRVCGMH